MRITKDPLDNSIYVYNIDSYNDIDILCNTSTSSVLRVLLKDALYALLDSNDNEVELYLDIEDIDVV